MATWREKARPVIAAVLRETAGQDETAIKKALFDAYPFAVREYYPYSVWLHEIKVQRGLKPKSKPKRGKVEIAPDPRQPEMFT